MRIIQVEGHSLIKFQTKERIEQIQRGHLYLKSCKWYRDYELQNGDCVIGDAFEAMLHAHEAELIITDTDQRFVIKDGLINTACSNGYTFCMFSIDSKRLDSFQFSPEQKQEFKNFGDTALLILNSNEFLHRVNKAIIEHGFLMNCGFISYFDESIDTVEYIINVSTNLRNIAFWKRKKYSYQQEFRILIYSDTMLTEDHIEIDIGDISDISVILDTDSVLKSRVEKGGQPEAAK